MKLTLDDLMPSGDSYSVIKNSLLGIVAVFAVIQLLGVACGRKKKRYSEKFEEFSKESEVDFDEAND
jgi:hypothetical protein